MNTSTPVLGDDGLYTVTLSYNLSETSDIRRGIVKVTGLETSLSDEIIIIQMEPDTETISIPDQYMREYCEGQNWIFYLYGSQCVMLDAGRNATTFNYTSNYNKQISDLTGIENFQNLTYLKLGYIENFKALDISELHNIATLTISYPRNVSVYNLGDNPITSFNCGGASAYSYSENITIIGSKIETITMTVASYYQSYDCVTTIDVSQCPALTTLNANRSSKVTTLYLSESQNITSLTKNDATEIVYK